MGENVLTNAAKSTLHIRASARPPPRHDRGELGQILHSKLRPLARYGHDKIIGHQAGPSRRQRREMTTSRSVEHAIFAPVWAPDHYIDFLTTQRMERMRDPDRLGHWLGASCSR